MASIASSVIGGIVGAGTNIYNTKKQNETNAKINQQQLDFQREQNNIMREREDTAVQRRQADLQEAGINPLLAGNEGASASGGLGAPAMIGAQSAQVGDIIQGTGQQIIQDRKTNEEIGNIASETQKNEQYMKFLELEKPEQLRLLDEQINGAQLNNKATEENIRKILADTEAVKQSALLSGAQQKLITAQTVTERQEALKVTQAIGLMKEQVNTQGAETAKKWQEVEKSKAETDKLLEEIDQVVKNKNIQDINLEWLNQEKKAGIIQTWSKVIGNVLGSVDF